MSWTYLVSLLPLIFKCAVLYGAVALVLRLAAGPRVVQAFLTASVPVIAVLVAGMIAFEVVAYGARLVAYRGGALGERQGGDLQLYWLITRFAFFILYSSALIWVAVWGFLAGDRLAGRGVLVAASSVTALLALMVLTLSFVDFVHACLVGIPFVLTNTTC
jgi:hypothetical protein